MIKKDECFGSNAINDIVNGGPNLPKMELKNSDKGLFFGEKSFPVNCWYQEKIILKLCYLRKIAFERNKGSR